MLSTPAVDRSAARPIVARWLTPVQPTDAPHLEQPALHNLRDSVRSAPETGRLPDDGRHLCTRCSTPLTVARHPGRADAYL
jgi:hypothetical protein